MIGTGRKAARARAVGLVLAGITAGSLLGGPAVAHVGKRVGHLQTHLDPVYLNEGQKANDSNLLDGLDSTQFLRSNAKATDADLLDGVSSAGFLAAGGKAVDADKLDNIDSASFLLGTSTLSGTRSCPGAGFYPEDAGTDYATEAATGERFAPTPAADVFRCAVDLPNGATVSSATFTVNDPAAGGTVSACSLTRTDQTVPVGNEELVTTAPAATSNAGPVTVTGNAIPANATINNSGFGYSFECTLGADTGIYGASVSYTVPASAG
jgi:hypothetical protein